MGHPVYVPYNGLYRSVFLKNCVISSVCLSIYRWGFSYIFMSIFQVNKVTFHPIEANYLLSGSQDGTMKLFDTRTHEAATVFVTKAYSVR